MKSRPKGRKAPRIVRRIQADGTVKEYRYAPYRAKPRVAPTDTIDALVTQYQRSPEWDALADKTRETYGLYQRCLIRVGHVRVSEIRRREILAVRDAIAQTSGHGAAQVFIRAVSVLFRWAIQRDWIEHSPVTKIPALKGGELRAWTAQEADKAQAGLPEHLRRVVVLARYTGQRRGDLCAMTWAQFDGEAITLKQEKAGKDAEPIVIPCDPILRAELLAWRNDPVVALPARTILVNSFGRPWRPQTLSEKLPVALVKLGLPRDLNVHGLRKLAATSLANAGCSPHQIAAITGHRTLAMVQHYTKAVDQRRLAIEAIERLQTRDNKNSG
jgi:integrase